MKTIIIKNIRAKEIQTLAQRPAIKVANIYPRVKKILEDVKRRGNRAVRAYTRRFDGVDSKSFAVGRKEWTNAVRQVAPSIRRAFLQAAANITKFHKAQLLKEKRIRTMKGVMCWREWRAIEKVGLYIPKGLPSTALMLGIPAKLAGCREIVMCTSPEKDGSVAKEILFAARLTGVKKVFKVGGVQAIGALAYGTETIPRVDKIFGPGNQYVTAAKALVSIDPNGASIDMPAGPSEVLVIADKSAPAQFVAADLLGQIEHGPDSPFVLVTDSKELALEAKKEVQKQAAAFPKLRQGSMRESLKESRIVIVPSFKEAFLVSNLYAPEHLILNIKNPEAYVSFVQNAGSVFLGRYTPEPLGDYASGTNHSLPTMGYARSYGGVSIDSFVKKVTFQKATKEGLRTISSIVEILADTERMYAHKNTVTIRLKSDSLRKK